MKYEIILDLIKRLPTAFTAALDSTAEKMPIGERVTYALQVSLIGMLAVFAVLTIIWGALVLMRIVIEAITKQKNKKNKGSDTNEPAVEASAEEASSVDYDDEQLVAVITAAVAAARADEAKKDGRTAGGFRVVSFKRTLK